MTVVRAFCVGPSALYFLAVLNPALRAGLLCDRAVGAKRVLTSALRAGLLFAAPLALNEQEQEQEQMQMQMQMQMQEQEQMQMQMQEQEQMQGQLQGQLQIQGSLHYASQRQRRDASVEMTGYGWGRFWVGRVLGGDRVWVGFREMQVPSG